MWGMPPPTRMPPLDWERIGDSLFDGAKWGTATYRLKVPGGWLIMLWLQDTCTGALSTTFVPDPEHKWEGTPLP